MTEQKAFDFRRRPGAPSIDARKEDRRKAEAKRQVRKLLELRCRGKDSATRSSKIREAAGLPASLTEEIVREVIRELILDGLAIGSCAKGYFVIQTQKELKEVVDGLRARQQGIETRIQLISHAFGLNGVVSDLGE